MHKFNWILLKMKGGHVGMGMLCDFDFFPWIMGTKEKGMSLP